MMLDLVHALGALDAFGTLDGSMVLASGGDSEGDIRYLGLLLLLSGFIFYGVVYLRYRNTDKRHRHESETEARMLEVRAADHHVDTKKGVRHSRMKGANNGDVRGSSNQGGLFDGALGGLVNDAAGKFPGPGLPRG